MDTLTNARQAVVDFVEVFTPSLDEMMTSMMAGPHEVPFGHVADQTYRPKRKKKKKRGDHNQSRRPNKEARGGQEQSSSDRTRKLIADALGSAVGGPAGVEAKPEDLDETAGREQLPSDGRRLPVATELVGVLESRVRRGLRMELQGDNTQSTDRRHQLHVRAKQEDR